MRALAPFVGLIGSVAAQSDEAIRPHEGVRVVMAEASTEWMLPRSHRSAFAFVGDDRLLCLARRRGSEEATFSGVILLSDDAGIRWRELVRVPGGDGFGFGAIATQPDSNSVEVLWDAVDDSGFRSTYHGTFDIDAGAWKGSPTRLERGTNANDHYAAEDLGIAEDGTVVAVMSAHRRPTQPWQSWAAGIRVRAPGADTWSEPVIASGVATGVAPNLQIYGRTAYLSYRSSVPDHGIYVRALDMDRGEWLDEQRRVDQPHAALQAANTSSLVVDASGDLYVMYARGVTPAWTRRPQPVGEQLCVAFAPDRDLDRLTQIVIDSDPGQKGGNHNPVNFSLARGPGEQVIAFYSKLGEQCRTLYRVTLDGGRRIGKPKPVASGVDGAFARVNGVRSDRFTSTMRVLTSGPRVVDGPSGIFGWAQRWPVVTYWR